MTNEDLKSEIKEKYGRVDKFLRLTNLEYHQYYRMLVNDPGSLKKVVDKTENEDVPGYDLTQDLRQKIRIEILKRYKSVSEFARKHTYYDWWLSGVINGKINWITPKIEKLLKTLNIDKNA